MNPKAVKRLSMALLADIMDVMSAENLEKYRELSKEVDRLVEESIIPEVRRHVR